VFCLPGLRIARWFFTALGAAAAVLILFGVYAYYTNFAQLGNLMRVVYLVRTQALDPAAASRLVQGASEGLVEALDDPYSQYLEPEMYSRLKMQLESTFGGLGVLVGMRGDKLTVVRPYEDTPAARAGIRGGDVILEIDGTKTQGMDLETAVSLMKGPVGTKVSLLIERPGHDDPLLFEVSREEIQVPTVYSEMLDGGIGHLVITHFAVHTAAEVREEVEKLVEQGMRALILDLRDNPGGSLTSAVDVADIFLEKGLIVSVDYRAARDETFHARPPALNLPLAVLINENSASASEILAGAVRDNGAGTLIGQRTHGKGVVQILYGLADGAGLKLTTGRYLTPSGHDLNGRGIEPDITVAQPEDGSDDRQLQAAIEVLQQ